MKTKRKKKRPSEEEIDVLVVTESGNEHAWSKPVKVQKTRTMGKQGNDIGVPSEIQNHRKV